jgi:hypothetical protein
MNNRLDTTEHIINVEDTEKINQKGKNNQRNEK